MLKLELQFEEFQSLLLLPSPLLASLKNLIGIIRALVRNFISMVSPKIGEYMY